MKRFLFLFTIILLLFPLFATAQWTTYTNDDTVVRPYTEIMVIPTLECTSATLKGLLDYTTTPTVSQTILRSSMSGKTTDDTQYTFTGLTAIKGCRSLSVGYKDAATYQATATVLITGKNQWGRNVQDTITFTASSYKYCTTQNAYVGTPTVKITSKNAAAADVIVIACYGYGTRCRASTIANIIFCPLDSGTIATLSTYTWNSYFGIISYPTDLFAVKDVVQITAYQNLSTRCPSGNQSITANSTGHGFFL